jgi:NAD(P)-dependent dehydrogenase (short-subunit alcohol dehydrogenase family)
MSAFRLDGQVAVVTGAFGRLGPVWVQALLEAGASVLAIDLPAQTAPSVLAAHGARLMTAAADILERSALEGALRRCLERFGAPSILVNNAGIDQPPSGAGTTYRVEDWPLAAWQSVLDVNLLGAFQATQVFGAAMLAAGRGSIINIASLYASVAPDSRYYDHLKHDPPFLKPPAYGASKAALVNLTRQLAGLWAPRGVRVNALSPGGVVGDQDGEFQRKFTSRVPLGRMAVPADLGGPLVFLASDASAYVTGVELLVDGGYTVW